MSSILSTNALTITANVTLNSSAVSPTVQLISTRAAELNYEVSLIVPDTGHISFQGELSTNAGASWRVIAIDGMDGTVPKVGGSSNVRFFTRYPLVKPSTYTIRARATSVIGTWKATVRAEVI